MLKLLKITFLIKRKDVERIPWAKRISTDDVLFATAYEQIITSSSEEALIPFMYLKYYLDDQVPTGTFLKVMQDELNGKKHYHKLSYISYIIEEIEEIPTKELPQTND